MQFMTFLKLIILLNISMYHSRETKSNENKFTAIRRDSSHKRACSRSLEKSSRIDVLENLRIRSSSWTSGIVRSNVYTISTRSTKIERTSIFILMILISVPTIHLQCTVWILILILVDNEIWREGQCEWFDTRPNCQPSSRRTKNLGKSQSKCARANSRTRQSKKINVEIAVNITLARDEFPQQ